MVELPEDEAAAVVAEVTVVPEFAVPELMTAGAEAGRVDVALEFDWVAKYDAPPPLPSPSVLAAGVKGGSLRFLEGVWVWRCGSPMVDVAGVLAAELDTSGTEL